jgi:hypothetical protein
MPALVAGMRVLLAAAQQGVDGRKKRGKPGNRKML